MLPQTQPADNALAEVCVQNGVKATDDSRALWRVEALGVVSAVLENWSCWRPYFIDLFWIRPSWAWLGVRNSTEYNP